MTSTADSRPPSLPFTEADTDADRWQRWRAERDDSLRAPHGWLSVTALHWLEGRPRDLDGVPGSWSGDDGGVHVLARAQDGLREPATGRPFEGARTTVVGEAGSRTAARFGGVDDRQVEVEALRRTGRPGVRVRDSHAGALARFTGVPVYAYDPAWVLPATLRQVTPYQVRVGAAQPGLHHDVQVVGEVDLERAGQTVTLRLVGVRERAALLFEDPSTDTAEWRTLELDPGAFGPDGHGWLDLNRTVNLPYAFSAFGTCPRPVEGNTVPFAVTAGERRP